MNTTTTIERKIFVRFYVTSKSKPDSSFTRFLIIPMIVFIISSNIISKAQVPVSLRATGNYVILTTSGTSAVPATSDRKMFFQNAVTLDTSSVTFPGVTNADETGETEQKITLSQNYPNPFNPSTIIQYSLEKPGMVSLKVFNILGKEVITLVNSQQDAGNYSVAFIANEETLKFTSGVYFYRLEVGAVIDGFSVSERSFVSTKKLLFIK